MSDTGLDVLDKSIQKTHIWLNDLMHRLHTKDRHQAYTGLKVTLHALRDRLSVTEAAHLGAQLPLVIRGVYYEGWQPSHQAGEKADWDAFMRPIELALCQDGQWVPEEIVAAVFAVLAEHVSHGEISDVVGQLPHKLRAQWPKEARVVLR